MSARRARPLGGALFVALLAQFCNPAFAGPARAAPPFTTEAERCLLPAAEFHGVNVYVLRVILRVESGLNPTAVSRNVNGTKDVGIGQMNSIHFKELGRYGIAPEHLLDSCIGTYVAAWQLKKGMVKFGNTWYGVAAYHSTTHYFNARYQVLLKNELIRMGMLSGRLETVPPLVPTGREAKGGGAKPVSTALAKVLVLNE